MAGGSALDEFTTLMESQGPAWMRGPDVMVNELVKNTYTYPRMQSGKPMEELIQGGDQVQDRILLQINSTFERYNPNAEFEYSMSQPGTNWSIPWAFAKAEVTWTKQDLGLNKDVHGPKYRAQRYKAVMRQKHQELWTDVYNSMDDELWARPNQNRMESTTPNGPRLPYSIPVFINEYNNGLPPAAVDAGATAWTQVMTIDPTAFPNTEAPSTAPRSLWGPHREDYTFTSATAIGSAAVFPAMTRMYWKTRFDRLPKRPEYSDKTTSPHVIMCSLQGLTNYEFALRSNQDEFRGMGSASGQDPAYPGPTFRGTPLQYISELDNALLYRTGAAEVVSHELNTANATNTANSDGIGGGFAGPRYYFVNGEYLKCVFHSENYCVLTKPIIPSKQPFSRVQVMDLWNQFVCRSRRRQGILYPSADTVDA